ncbi:hypothetical protein JV173_01365 [Acholeplasma equirhinis]|uniref:hypothetical protein n=1 Tax=Acholeplasma equirhinis TaxID=555393 RepID=UPI00197AFF98|nr:hypothetical protein [Acholeplasma equirhinis]MBN3490153.1 hypothetical protein [Acholeplasma equirhinis]
MNSIEKYNLVNKIVKIVSGLITLSFIVIMIIDLVSGTFFDRILTLYLPYFGIIVFIMLNVNFILDIERKKIIDKNFGPVTQEDRKQAKILYKRYLSLLANNTDFSGKYADFDFELISFKAVLKQLMRGYKVHYESVKHFYEMEVLLDSETFKEFSEDMSEFKSFVKSVTELFQNNRVEF